MVSTKHTHHLAENTCVGRLISFVIRANYDFFIVHHGCSQSRLKLLKLFFIHSFTSSLLDQKILLLGDLNRIIKLIYHLVDLLLSCLLLRFVLPLSYFNLLLEACRDLSAHHKVLWCHNRQVIHEVGSLECEPVSAPSEMGIDDPRLKSGYQDIFIEHFSRVNLV